RFDGLGLLGLEGRAQERLGRHLCGAKLDEHSVVGLAKVFVGLADAALPAIRARVRVLAALSADLDEIALCALRRLALAHSDDVVAQVASIHRGATARIVTDHDGGVADGPAQRAAILAGDLSRKRL